MLRTTGKPSAHKKTHTHTHTHTHTPGAGAEDPPGSRGSNRYAHRPDPSKTPADPIPHSVAQPRPTKTAGVGKPQGCQCSIMLSLAWPLVKQLHPPFPTAERGWGCVCVSERGWGCVCVCVSRERVGLCVCLCVSVSLCLRKHVWFQAECLRKHVWFQAGGGAAGPGGNRRMELCGCMQAYTRACIFSFTA